MLRNILIAFAAGSVGGISNVLFLVVAGAIGLPTLFGLALPDFGSASFLYKQVFWGGLWALTFLTPLAPSNWVLRAFVVAIASASLTFFVFFPMATIDGKGPGIAGLNIGMLMPVYVLLADLAYALVASKIFQFTNEAKEKI